MQRTIWRGALIIASALALGIGCSSGGDLGDRGDGNQPPGSGGSGGTAGGGPGGSGGTGGSGPGGTGGEPPPIQIGEHLRFWREAHGVPGLVRGIAADGAGNIWAANGAGLLLLRPGSETWESFDQTDGLSPWPTTSVAAGAEGQVWVGYEGIFPDENYFDDPPEVAKSGDVDLLQFDGAGLALVRHYDISSPPDPLYPMGRDVLRTCYRIVPVLDGPWAGDVWFGCNHGVAMWTERYSTVQEHQHTAIWRDGTDRTGDFRGVAVAPDGNVWMAGAHRGGLLRYADEGGQFWAEIGPEVDFWPETAALDPLGDDWTMALVADDVGGLWAGGFGNGLARMSPEGEWSWIQTGQGLPDDRVYDLALDTDGSLWVATDAGVVRLRDGTFDTPLNPLTGVPGTPLSIHIDASTSPRRLLIGTSAGAGIYDGP